ncbi:hypothetical protein MNBD_GAMMA26-1267 [hydrothermal vent metagenome]|uniref:Uncharacterized protein n=1 Tax=hydrothermal vent metagenome TaxID=652676 RepID=A0A3B1B0D4_9ZZZZ
MKQYLILGAGVAGRRAAEAILERDTDGLITILEEQENPLYARPMLGEWMGRDAGAKKAATKNGGPFSDQRIKFRPNVAAQEIRPEQQKVLLNTNELIHFDKLLIASGRRTGKLPCDQGNTTGIHYMDRLADIQAASNDISSAHKALISGSSYQALAAAKGLRNNGIDCTMVIPEPRIWPDILDNTASRILEQRLQQEKIQLVRNAEIQVILEDQGKLHSVIVSGGNRLPADLLIVTSPQIPKLDSLINTSLATPGGVEVDSTLHTSIENIYAAGDAALLPSELATNDHTQAGWLRAWKQGHIAGINMAGGSLTYKGIPSIRTRLFDLNIVCLGLSGAEGEDIQSQSGNYPYDEMPYIYKKILYKNDKVVGAIFIGDVSEAGMVEKWIANGLTKAECDTKVLTNMFEVQYASSAAYGVLCPVCKFHMQIDDRVKEGEVITCPACGIDFRVAQRSNGAFNAVPLN